MMQRPSVFAGRARVLTSELAREESETTSIRVSATGRRRSCRKTPGKPRATSLGGHAQTTLAQLLAQGGSNRYALGMAQAVRKVFAAGADTYDRARRKLVPCFDDFYRTALELLPFKSDDRFEALDLGAGTGLLSAMIAEAFPKARLTLFDLTPEMLMIARQRLKPLGKRVRFVTADFAAAAPSKSYDAVVSALAIHHLPDSGKRHLFADIFKYLTSGGVLINADQVAGETAAIDQRSRQMWIKRARELKVSERDLNAALERMKQDLPATVGQQLAWMRESGFTEVSCAYRNLIFAVVSGTKPVNALEAGSARRHAERSRCYLRGSPHTGSPTPANTSVF
jgi:tRNA (cmo5U34)-methyltransferase